VAAICGVLPVAISGILKPLPEEQRSQRPLAIPHAWRLPTCYGISLVLIGTTLISTTGPNVGFSVALLVVLASPLMLLLPSRRDLKLVPDTTTLIEWDRSDANEPELGRSPLESGPVGMLKCVDFYLLFAATFAIQSGGLFLTTNLGSMVESRTGPCVESATAVTIFSCFQGLSRLVTGFVTDRLFVSRGVPRTAGFPILMLLMACAHGVLAVRGPIALIAGTALSGAAFGAVYPLLVLAVTEMFGQEYIASNYMVFDGIPGAIGVVLIAKVLASRVYSAHTGLDPGSGDDESRCYDESGSGSGQGKCFGDECFRLAHLAIVGVELLGCTLGVVLMIRTRNVYAAIFGQN